MKKIPLYRNEFDESEIEMVSRVIRRGMHWANGPEILAFEDRVRDLAGVRNCVSFSSGTSALHSVLEAIDIRGNEVIVPSFTFISTANSVLMAGGKPVFADIEEETFGLDVDDVSERITPDSKAIIPVHYAGCPCDIRGLVDLALDHGLFLMEDAAESLGARIDDKMVGSFGDCAMFSFTPTKVISTGEGGAVVTDDDKLAGKLRIIRSHGRTERSQPDGRVMTEYVSMGYNYRMSTMCAAMGLAQLEKVERFIKRRREIASLYAKELGRIGGIRTPHPPEGYHHIYQMYTIVFEDGASPRDRVREGLWKRGIDTKVNFEPVHRSRFYRDTLGYDTELPVTERLSRSVLSLPIFPGLSDDDVRYISGSIGDVLSE